MNRTLAIFSALGVGLSTVVFTGAGMAQAAAPAAPAAAAVKPEAIPAKIAILNFEGAVGQTNEGQKAFQALQEKYGPQQQKIQSEAADVDALRKQLDALPTTTSDAERQQRVAAIDAKEKQLNLDNETFQNTSGADLQQTMAKIAAKVSPIVTKYLKDNGYTLMLSAGGQQSDVLWADERTDITTAVIEAYNASSGVSAPAPAAPAAAPRRTGPAAPASTAPRTAPKAPAK